LRNPKCPIGLGEPVFDKLHAELGKAMLSINAVHGFEYGSDFGARMKGSKHNDFIQRRWKYQTNLSGGIQGGISNGMDIYSSCFQASRDFNPKQVLTNQNTIRTARKRTSRSCVVQRRSNCQQQWQPSFLPILS
jgi:chorismate synthase